MNDALGRRETELEVVAEAQQRATDRVQVLVGGLDDLGPRHGGDNSVKTAQVVRRVAGCVKRPDTVDPPGGGMTAHVGWHEPPERMDHRVGPRHGNAVQGVAVVGLYLKSSACYHMSKE